MGRWFSTHMSYNIHCWWIIRVLWLISTLKHDTEITELCLFYLNSFLIDQETNSGKSYAILIASSPKTSCRLFEYNFLKVVNWWVLKASRKNQNTCSSKEFQLMVTRHTHTKKKNLTQTWVKLHNLNDRNPKCCWISSYFQFFKSQLVSLDRG